MAEHELLDALDDCMDRLSTGQSVEDCLRSHPHQAAALRLMLEAGLLARRARVSSVEVAQAQDRVRFRIAQHRRRTHSPMAVLRLAASFMIVFIFAMGSLGFAAESSLPGDTLYNVKRLTESVRLLVGGDDGTLRQQLAQRRVGEVTRLLALRRTADVEFQGELQAQQDSNWRVADLPVLILPGTQGVQSVQIGDLIEVHGSTTTQGSLIARDVALLQRGTPVVTPTPTATATSTPTVTPTMIPTRTPVRRVPTGPPPTIMPTVDSSSSGSSGDNGSHHSGDGSGDSSGSGSSGSDGSGSGSDGGGSHGSDDGK